MRNNVRQVDKSCISEIQIIDAAIDLLFSGQSIPKCGSFILSEYEVDVNILDELLERAQGEVRQCKAEMYQGIKF